MDFAFSDEQQMLRDAARDYLRDRFPADRVAALADSPAGWDPDCWPQLTAMGWLDPDLGAVEHAILLEETGAALLPGPLASTLALAAPAMVAAGRALDRPVTLAWAGPGAVYLADVLAGRGGEHAPGTVARASGQGWELTGRTCFVPDLSAAEEIVVVARTAQGPGLWLVEATRAGDDIRPLSTTDRTRRLGDLMLAGQPATLLVGPPHAVEVLAATRRRALALLSCEALGVARYALDLAAAHARTREQFGRPIGSYQAVSHRVADVYVALELARSLAYRAAWAVAVLESSAGSPEPGRPAAPATITLADADAAIEAAKSAAGAAAVLACESAIQVLGGYGFTWDSPLHRFYKRAQAIEAFEGVGAAARRRIARALLDD